MSDLYAMEPRDIDESRERKNDNIDKVFMKHNITKIRNFLQTVPWKMCSHPNVFCKKGALQNC